MDSLGRFYTDTLISQLLISTFENQSPKKVIDLGVGDASLSIVAFSKWEKANFYATEIDDHKVRSLKERLAFLKVYNYDTLEPNLSAKLKIKFGSIDVAICNPPYIPVEDKDQYKELFNEIDCPSFNKLKRITSEIVFFAHNLKLLKRNGELGIIVSDTLVAGKEFKDFRQAILERYDVRKVIQLPDNIFKKTEARTHIIFIAKKRPTSATVCLHGSDIIGLLTEKKAIQRKDLIERMDYGYHSQICDLPTSTLSLKDVASEIKRGSLSYKALRKSDYPFLHTIHLPRNSSRIAFSEEAPTLPNIRVAEEGDIIMGRVGKGCVGRLLYVEKGSIVLSDCVYKISVRKEFRDVVWRSLNSEQGRRWISANIHGVCSKLISKCDLENFPLYDNVMM